LLRSTNGTFIDIALASLPFEERLIGRSTQFEYAPGFIITTASAEDLVVTKAFAARHRDWSDIDGILIKQREVLDWDYINRELAPLCELKEAPEILEQLGEMRRQIEAE
jgi:hypothetical protein